jgi:hypothetical protein
VPLGRLGRAQLGAQLANRALALGEHVVGVDRLEVHLARVEEVCVCEIRQGVERALEREPHRVLDEPWLQVCVLDDEQLVGPLQQLVDRRAHRVLDDRDEIVGVEPPLGPDIERPLAALVVRRERDEIENPLDVLVPGLGEALGGTTSHEPLRARAGVDSRRLDADDSPDALGRGRGDADQGDHLLRGQLADGRRSAHGPPGGDARFGSECALPADDVAGDVLGQRLHVQCLATHHRLDRFFEDFSEARHVGALLAVGEIDGALDLRCHHGLAPLVPDAHGFLDASHACPGQREPHLRSRGLEIVDRA